MNERHEDTAAREMAARHEARLGRVRLYAKALLKIMTVVPPNTGAGCDELARRFVMLVEAFDAEQMRADEDTAKSA